MAIIQDFLDPITLERVVRELERTATGVTDIERRLDTTGRVLREVTRETHNLDRGWVGVGKVITSTLDETGRRYQYFLKVEFLRSTEDALEKAKARWKAYGEEVKRHMTEARGGLGAAGGALGLSGNRGAFSGASNMFSSVMGSMPFGIGGVLGLILYGRKREAEFDAASIRISRIMDQIGQGSRAAGELRGRVESMHHAFGSFGEEMQAVLESFRQFGMGAEVFEETRHSAGALGKDLIGVVTALEMANRMGPGSLAKMIGEVFEGGGAERTELLDDFMELDRIAQRTGVSVERLMSTMTQSASSLRLQRQSVGDLSDGYIKLFDALRGGALQGSAPQAVGAAAMRGIQAAAGGLGGLSEGLMAELSRRMGGPEGVGGIIAMQEGMRGQGDFAGGVFDELGALAREITGDGPREEQIFALQKIAPSLGFEGARAVVDMMSGGATLADVQESIKDPQAKLLDAFGRRSAEESAWEKVQRQVMMHMATIGSSMLSITVAGFDAVVKLLGATVGVNDMREASAAAVKFREIQGTEATNMLGALEGISKAAGGGIGIPVPDWVRSNADRHAAQKREQAVRAAAEQRVLTQENQAAATQVEGLVANFGDLPSDEQSRLRQFVQTRRRMAARDGKKGLALTTVGADAVREFYSDQEGRAVQEVPAGVGVRLKIIVERDDMSRMEVHE